METENIKNKQPINSRTRANFISILFFWWIIPIVKLGYKKELQIEDLYKVNPDDQSDELGLLLQREWGKELVKFKTNGAQPSLTKALFRSFGVRFMFLGILAFIEEVIFKLGQPLCLGLLIHYFDPGSDMSKEAAYLYATGVVLGSALYAMIHYQYFFESVHTGMKARVASCSLMYKKCMVLSQKSLGQTTIGQMVNIMTNDVNRFDGTLVFLHYLWIAPIQALVATTILLFVIGPSCLVGLGVLILFAPLQMFVGRMFSKLRMKTAKRTDKRLQVMNEILSGMRIIKMYTWEKPFAKLTELCRREEINVIRTTSYFRALNSTLFYTTSRLIIFLTFVVYVLTGNGLTADKVFLTVAIFNNISLAAASYFPLAITSLAEVRVTLERIQTFLLLDEMDGITERPLPSSNEGCCQIELSNVTVKWPAASESEGNTLTDVSFTARPGQVLAIIGQVGSGKSSLLHVLLRELSAYISGSCKVVGKIAYAPQESWIFSGTIRQNILCGLDYDAQRYKAVVQAAALGKDFSLFPSGDETPVGERGVQLSGGQKARINLARCLYVDADVYLLDDPLSAVDTHVGRHLFDQAIKDFLSQKIRILVTHQLQYLKDVDQILVLKGGRVEASGTFKELYESGLDFAKTVKMEEEMEDDEIKPSSRTPSIRSRSESTSSRTSTISRFSAQPNNESKPAFEEESRSQGRVTLSVYRKYFRDGGPYISFAFFIITCFATQAFISCCDYWLNIWTNAEQNHSGSKSWQDDVDTRTGIVVYSILVVGIFIFSMARTIHFFLICLTSSIVLHNRMFQSVIRAPLLFFDRNPVGRILNRFAKDIGNMDEVLPTTIMDVINTALYTTGIIVVVAVVNPWLILPIFFVALVMYKLRGVYLATARAVKRLEATARSPVFTHLSSSLTGLTTLRAHKCETSFQRSFDGYQDIHSSAYYIFIAISRWFGMWMDWICIFYVACVTYASVALRDHISSSEAGLVITSAMSLTWTVMWGARQSAEMENQMTSVERVIEYSQLPSEAPLESASDAKPPSTWPSEGSIQMDDMSLRYNDVDPPVLKGISCVIKPKEKIGIVGRTGAGKSSLIAALFRLAEPDGRIIIDGIESKSIGLHDLRSNISIIPQDPILFSGSLRKNLDPFGEFSDDTLWNALEDVKLKEVVVDLPSGLEFTMTEGGSNFSVGQRQLVCLARAILRRNRILVLDEATANVDQKTDSLIQLTIRNKFMDCTVLTIAHRLNTIMDSDRVMVIDAGYLKEFDEPLLLLENPKSFFYYLVEQTGTQGAAELTLLAQEGSKRRRDIIKSVE